MYSDQFLEMDSQNGSIIYWYEFKLQYAKKSKACPWIYNKAIFYNGLNKMNNDNCKFIEKLRKYLSPLNLDYS